MAPAPQTDDRLDALLAEYFQKLDLGEAVSPTSLVASHPDLAEPLREFFDAASFVENLAGPTHSEQTQMLNMHDTARSVLIGETIVSSLHSRDHWSRSGDAARPLVAAMQHFGRYEIVRLLGQGAMGAVYLAYDPSLQRQVALKIPKFNADENADMSNRFLREARSAATLRHANICPVYDVGRVDGVHYITMAYIEGRTLAEELRAGRTFQPREIATIVRKLALALSKAHSAGVVHRDLKPGNIMLDPDGEPILMDFGLAYREETDELRLTKSGMIVGSPAYMSPEQIDGDPTKIGPASDIYSLGVVLYEMITGKLPFSGTMMSVIGQIATKEPTPVGHWRKELADSPLERLCRKMLAKQTKDRPATMHDVAAALDFVLSGLPGEGVGRRESGVGTSNAEPAARQEPRPPDSRPPIPDSRFPTPDSRPIKFPEAVLAQERRDRAKMFLATTLILAALVGLFGALAGIVYVATNQGTLQITSSVDNVQIEVANKDGTIKVIDLTSGTEVHRLPLGDYTIKLKGDRTDVFLDHNGFKMKRGGKVIVEAALIAKTNVSVPMPTQAAEAATPRQPTQGELTQLVQLEGHESYSLNLDFSPGGQQIVTACGQPDCHVRLWDARNGRLQREFKSGTRSLHDVKFSPDGKYVAAAGKSGEIILLDAKELKVIRRWKAHDKFIDCLAFAPDSKRLASGSDNWGRPEADVSVRVWDVETGSLAWKQDLPQIVRGRPGGERGGQVFGLAWSPDGAQLLSAHQGPEEQITIWQADSGTLVRKFGKSAAPVRCADWSPDGRIIATGHTALNMVGNRWADPENCVVRLYDAATGSELRTLQGHTGPLESLDFSSDSKLLVSSSGGQYLNDDFYERESSDNSIRIWDVAAGRELLKRDLGSPVKCVRFSPDGTKIASSAGAVGAKADVQIWSVPQNLQLPFQPALPDPQPLAQLLGHKLEVRAVAFSPDDQEFVTVGWDGKIRVWNSAEQKLARSWPAHDGGIYRAQYLPDGRLITAGFDQTIRVWDMTKGEELTKLSAHSGPVCGLAVTADGKRGLSSSFDGKIILWDLEKFEEIRTFPKTEGAIWTADFSSDGRTVATGEFTGAVRVWDVEKGEIVATLGRHPDATLAVAFVGDGSQLLSAGRDGTVNLWDVNEKRIVRSQTFAGAWIESLSVSHDGKLALVALANPDQQQPPSPLAGQVVVWDVAAGQEVGRLATGMPYIYATGFSGDGKWLLTGGGHARGAAGAAQFWRLEDVLKGNAASSPPAAADSALVEVLQIGGHVEHVTSLAITGDGKTVVSGSADGTVLARDIQPRVTRRALSGHRRDRQVAVAVSRDGKLLVSGDWDGKLRLNASGKDVNEIDAHPGGVMSVQLSPDETILLTTGGDNTAKTWDVATGKLLQTFPGTGWVSDGDFSPSGKLAVTSGFDGKLAIWQVADAVLFKELPTGGVMASCVDWAPAGGRIAAGFRDGTVRIFSDDTGEETMRLAGHTDRVRDVVFTPDGRHLVSGSYDRTLRLWNVETGAELARVEHEKHIFNALAIAPDGRHAFSAGGIWKPDEEKNEWTPEQDYAVRMWRLPQSVWQE